MRCGGEAAPQTKRAAQRFRWRLKSREETPKKGGDNAVTSSHTLDMQKPRSKAGL